MFITFFLLGTIVILILSAANKILYPPLTDISSSKAVNIAENIVKSVVYDVFKKNINYEDLVYMEKDKNGNLVSLQTDVSKLNMLSAMISKEILMKLESQEKQSISIPLGAVTGKSIIAAKGPNVYIGVYPYGDVKTDYISEFTDAGINQTRHRIYIKVTTKIGMTGPVKDKKLEINTAIPIAETIIIGKVPKLYVETGSE
jgi:sporulation protein YunB